VLIEAKDFRKHRIETKQRIEGGNDPLWLEVSKKMRDSVAVTVGAGRNAAIDKDAWKACLELLRNEKKKIHLILWLEQDPPPYALKARRNRELSDRYLLRKLKNSLDWLTPKVQVCDVSTHPFPGNLSISYV